uniref:Usp domain-containing protein n=1 Tax=Macrostomum lignano TaxID=282301 RepID=A0A1I8IA46_9PLAT
MVVEPRVARSSSLTPAEAPKYFSDRMSEAMQAGRDIVDGVRQRCASLGIRNELQFVEKVSSSPGAAIVEAANEERVDLIVMGNRGLGKLRRTFLGSVSDYVLHHAHRAVAVVPPNSFMALSYYAQTAHRESDQLIFAYAAEPPSLPRGTGASLLAETEAYAGMMREAVERGKELGQRIRSRCQRLGLHNATKFVEKLSSQAGPVIVDVAKDESVDLILLGSRGHGTLRRTILGSVSDYVLHHAHLPTIVVPFSEGSRKSSTASRKSSTASRKSSTASRH